MGRILIRRGGETIAAGKICKSTCPEDGSDPIGRRRSGNQWLEQAGMSKEGYIDITVMLKKSKIPSVHVSVGNTANMAVGNRRNSECIERT
jgi:hypothetical protein